MSAHPPFPVLLSTKAESFSPAHAPAPHQSPRAPRHHPGFDLHRVLSACEVFPGAAEGACLSSLRHWAPSRSRPWLRYHIVCVTQSLDLSTEWLANLFMATRKKRTPGSRPPSFKRKQEFGWKRSTVSTF